MNNAVFGKTMENVRNHRDIKLVTAKRRRIYLASQPNYYATKWFTKKLLAIKMNKVKARYKSKNVKAKYICEYLPEDPGKTHRSLRLIQVGIPIGINKNVIELMKDKMDGKIIKKFVASRPKTQLFNA